MKQTHLTRTKSDCTFIISEWTEIYESEKSKPDFTKAWLEPRFPNPNSEQGLIMSIPLNLGFLTSLYLVLYRQIRDIILGPVFIKKYIDTQMI